jgi:hypothetical protein
MTATGLRGSRRGMCEWVNRNPAELESYFASWPCFRELRAHGSLEWLSPLKAACYREVRDGLWAEAGLPRPSPQDVGWWPRRGPQWDGVAIVRGAGGTTRGVLLVEAKSHLAELVSPPSGANGDRLTTIRDALEEVQAYVGGSGGSDWWRRYYQMTNRLAYLYYLRVKLGFPSCLLFVYFVGDEFGTPGVRAFPASEAEWRPAIDAAKAELGIEGTHRLSDFTFEAFVPAEPPRTAGQNGW